MNGYIDPAKVILPTGSAYVRQTVAEADDDTLRDCLRKDLASIRDIVTGSNSPSMRGYEPDADGMPPTEWLEVARANARGMGPNLKAIERAMVPIEAIRTELPRREQERAARREAEAQDARERLEKVLADAPKKAAELKAIGEQVAEAFATVRAFIEALELVGGSGGLWSQHQTITDGALTAAKVLGKPVPKLPDLPAPLPTSHEIQTILARLQGRGGFDRLSVPLGDAPVAADLARKMD